LNAEEAGEESLFLFGLTADQMGATRGWYNPVLHYDNAPETRAALDLIFSDTSPAMNRASSSRSGKHG
jgi:starch phosphorylase